LRLNHHGGRHDPTAIWQPSYGAFVLAKDLHFTISVPFVRPFALTRPVLTATTVATINQSRKITIADREAFRRKEQLQMQARAMERFQKRDWRSGDVYAPHDLSAAEARKWSKRYSPTTDAFDALNLNPLDLYKNFSIMSEYVTEMGRIRHSKETGLRPVNQRKIAKAIRRAVALGLMPSVHRHPEILKRMQDEQFMNSGGR
jgi:ribosomal protein S18